MINKITVYSREVRDYYSGEDITQYMLAPEVAEKRDYMDTDCLAVSMDAAEPAGEFRLRCPAKFAARVRARSSTLTENISPCGIFSRARLAGTGGWCGSREAETI